MKLRKWIGILAVLILAVSAASAAKKKDKQKDKGEDAAASPYDASLFGAMSFRSVGPALTSGRIGHIAVHPENKAVWYVAVASGGVWKTVNAGTTWQPIFDQQGSYSIGCVTIDPHNPNVIWVGTGENNSQRSVGYGDGIYKSRDGGKSWQHMGLKESEHIARILVHPQDANTVYVASQGPLWSSGGDRGLYKTTDGGQNWEAVLTVDEHTGVTDVVMDPRNPDTLIAATYQRRRHVWTLINGGPGSGIHKTTDGGKNWRQLRSGLPGAEMGRIGLAMAPSDPDVVYAVIEAREDKGGFYRSDDIGESWSRQSDYVAGSPQYYQELIVDPTDPNRIFTMDTWLQVSENGGKSFERVYQTAMHVDHHAFYIDPDNTDHMITGNDGGVYETFDGGQSWSFFDNLPITQYYKVAVDNSEPFYYIYGGTQDNFSMGGPSRTTSANGIMNRDWFMTLGGDGFESQVDPEDPNIVYSQYQYGNLARFDRRSGEVIFLQPQEGKADPPLRWNWDSALLISPHAHKRLYFAANILFRSDDRGNTWEPVSDDLTRNMDRNTLKVMDRVWSIDAVAKNNSTSFYGTIVALDESRLKPGLLIVGTDDGLIQIRDGYDAEWREVDGVEGVPAMTYVNMVAASKHDQNTIYAAFNNHKKGDFKPYLMKSTDLGQSWTSIASDLPDRGSVYAIAEDHVDPDLLFAGTEFGVFFSPDRGEHWVPLKSGVPTIAVRDIAIQERESDLVLGTFGRGFYVLDNYAPLRDVSTEMLAKDAALFPVKDAWVFIEEQVLGIPGKGFRGDNFYTAPNPDMGAVFTYYLKDSIETRKQKRQKAEQEVAKDGGDVAYPSWDEWREERREEDPAIILTIRDEDGQVVRRLEGPARKGLHRITWDHRYPAFTPVRFGGSGFYNPFSSGAQGPLAVPGEYTVSLAKRVDGELVDMELNRPFTTKALRNTTLPAKDRDALLAFKMKTARLQRAVVGSTRALSEASERLRYLKKAVELTPAATVDHHNRVRDLEARLDALQLTMFGDRDIAAASEPAAPGLSGRVRTIVGGHWNATTDTTETFRRNYEIAAAELSEWLPSFRQLVENDLATLEAELESLGAPWTPGRIPTWQPE